MPANGVAYTATAHGRQRATPPYDTNVPTPQALQGVNLCEHRGPQSGRSAGHPPRSTPGIRRFAWRSPARWPDSPEAGPEMRSALRASPPVTDPTNPTRVVGSLWPSGLPVLVGPPKGVGPGSPVGGPWSGWSGSGGVRAPAARGRTSRRLPSSVRRTVRTPRYSSRPLRSPCSFSLRVSVGSVTGICSPPSLPKRWAATKAA